MCKLFDSYRISSHENGENEEQTGTQMQRKAVSKLMDQLLWLG